MDCSEVLTIDYFYGLARFPIMQHMTTAQAEEYLGKLRALQSELHLTAEQLAKVHDFFYADAALICSNRASQRHIEALEYRHRPDVDEMYRRAHAHVLEELSHEDRQCCEEIRACMCRPYEPSVNIRVLGHEERRRA